MTVTAIVGRDDEPGDFWGTDRRQCSGRLDAAVATEAMVSDDDRSGMDAPMRLAELGLPGHAL